VSGLVLPRRDKVDGSGGTVNCGATRGRFFNDSIANGVGSGRVSWRTELLRFSGFLFRSGSDEEGGRFVVAGSGPVACRCCSEAI
jgi:hypothetical protein